MNLEDFNNIDRELEKENFEHKGIDLRGIVRDEIIYQIRRKKNEGIPRVSISLKLKIRLLKGLLLTIKNLFQKKDFWIISNSDRRKKLDDTYVDRVASVISDIYPDKTFFIESNTVTQHKRNNRDMILSESFLQLLVKFFIFFNRKEYINTKWDFSNLEEKFDVNINVNFQLLKFFGQYQAMNFFMKIKKKPKIVFLVYPTGYLGYIRKFKELNIPVVELQHGIIYKEHPSYNSSITIANRKLKPDYIFTYGKKDKVVLEELNFLPKKNIVSTGAYLLSYYRENDLKMSKYLEGILKGVFTNITIVTSTLADTDELFSLCNDLAKNCPEFLFLLLPRSSEYKNKNKRENNFKVLDSDKTSIYELLNYCDIHVTQVSTCSLEALFFNKKSLIYEKEKGTSFYRRNYDYINEIEYFSTVDEFKKQTSLPINLDNNNIDLLFENRNYQKTEKNIQKILNN